MCAFPAVSPAALSSSCCCSRLSLLSLSGKRTKGSVKLQETTRNEDSPTTDRVSVNFPDYGDVCLRSCMANRNKLHPSTSWAGPPSQIDLAPADCLLPDSVPVRSSRRTKFQTPPLPGSGRMACRQSTMETALYHPVLSRCCGGPPPVDRPATITLQNTFSPTHVKYTDG